MAAGAREDGGPARRVPVVLLHGFAQHADSWGEVARRLRERGHEVAAPELAGLPGAASGAGMAGVCAAVDSLCREVAHRAGRLPALAGYSMGGRIALETVQRSFGGGSPAGRPCADRPGAGQNADAARPPCCALVLESAGMGPETEGDRIRFAERNAEWARRVRKEGVEAFMDWWETLPLFASQRGLPSGVRARVRAGRMSNDPEGLAFQLEAWGAQHQALRPRAWGLLRDLAAGGFPVAYFAGELDGKYARVAQSAAGLPGVRAVVFPGVGHNVHVEDPDAFVGELCRVLPA